MLADLGAEVITVEPPRVASAKLKPIGRDTGARYLALNRNKKSITLDLNSEYGKEVFYKLTKKADVIVEGSRPGVAERLGIDYTITKKINPKIVYISISSFGQEGPYQKLSSHDINIVGISGLLNLKESSPVPTGILLSDTITALTSVIGILAALIEAQRTSRGRYVDLSMLDAMINCLNVKAMRCLLDTTQIPGDNDLTSFTFPFYNAYKAKDERYLTIAAVESHFWKKLCILMGRQDFITRQFDKGTKREEIFEFFRKFFATKTVDEWIKELQDVDIPCGRVNSIKEALQDPQVVFRGMVTESTHPLLGKIKQLGTPIKFSETLCESPSTAPMYGQHTNEILESIGYSKELIQNLRANGVIE
jgi:crotonobetainyl-CoA:carnitine CoA-transferase CaiB-like acyl-CoA transferase